VLVAEAVQAAIAKQAPQVVLVAVETVAQILSVAQVAVTQEAAAAVEVMGLPLVLVEATAAPAQSSSKCLVSTRPFSLAV
jgi:hypothetical protein